MDKKRFTGLGTALVTPFLNGGVDLEAYKRLVERQVRGGVDFLVALGTTAETPCLGDDEKESIIQATRSVYSGNLMVGVGTNSLCSTVKNIRLLEKYEADAWLVVAPYYNKPGQEGLYRYFEAVASETDRDVYVYNIPGRTGVNIAPETTARLAGIKNIKGIKDANADLEHLGKLRSLLPEDFILLSGNDDQWLTTAKMGFDGLISVVSNIVPSVMASLAKAIRGKNFEAAEIIDGNLRDLYKACFVESNPIPVKGALKLLELCSDEMRLPLTPATFDTVMLLAGTMTRLQEKGYDLK